MSAAHLRYAGFPVWYPLPSLAAGLQLLVTRLLVTLCLDKDS